MGFSGLRAIIMIGVLIVLVVAVTKSNLPNWCLPVGLIKAGVLMKGWEKRASS